MAKHLVQANNTSRSEYIFIQDSSSTTGAGLANLLFNSAGLTADYCVERGARTNITLVTLASATIAYSSGGFIAVDNTNMPGIYRFDVPNGLFSVAGTDKAILILKGATNMAPVVLEYQIVAFNPDDAVRMGMTALPNATAGASGGVPLSVNATGAVNVLQINGTAQTARDIGASVLVGDKTGFSLAAAQTFNTTGSVGSVTGSVGSVTGSVGSVTAGVTVTTNNDKTGYSLTTAPLTAGQTASAVWDALLSSYTVNNSFGQRVLRSTTSQSTCAVTGSNHIAADVHQFQPDVLTAAATDTTYVAELTSGGTSPTAVQIADAVLNRNLDSSGNGTDTTDERTVRSALRAMRNKVSVGSGTMTVYKEDDVTAAWTGTLSNTADVTVNPAGGS